MNDTLFVFVHSTTLLLSWIVGVRCSSQMRVCATGQGICSCVSYNCTIHYIHHLSLNNSNNNNTHTRNIVRILIIWIFSIQHLAHSCIYLTQWRERNQLNTIIVNTSIKHATTTSQQQNVSNHRHHNGNKHVFLHT